MKNLTFDRFIGILLVITVAGTIWTIHHNPVNSDRDVETIARFVVFWLMIAIGRYIVLTCRRWAS